MKRSDDKRALVFARLVTGIKEVMEKERIKRRRARGSKGRKVFPKRTVRDGWIKRMRKEQPELYEEARLKAKADRAHLVGSKPNDKPRKQEVVKAELEAAAARADVDDKDTARRELAQRELSRRFLIASIVRFNPEYLAGWVHKDICTRLEKFMVAVERGENPRLMFQMPPRHGKSTIASQEFPAWLLGHHPDWELIVCSYAESLALDFSRAVRARIRDKEYHALFPDTRLDADNQNAQGWKLTK
ncbi:MAG: hypothetical protein E4H01_10410, partial [Lysobacterales bacterium]